MDALSSIWKIVEHAVVRVPQDNILWDCILGSRMDNVSTVIYEEGVWLTLTLRAHGMMRFRHGVTRSSSRRLD